MPESVEKRVSASRSERLPRFANRPEPDWQGWTLRIPHESAGWGRRERARVSTTQVGAR
jgi:hypothetical protein